jgi:hypothetical protein
LRQIGDCLVEVQGQFAHRFGATRRSCVMRWRSLIAWTRKPMRNAPWPSSGHC